MKPFVFTHETFSLFHSAIIIKYILAWCSMWLRWLILSTWHTWKEGTFAEGLACPVGVFDDELMYVAQPTVGSTIPSQLAPLYEAPEHEHGSKTVSSVPPRSLLQVPLPGSWPESPQWWTWKVSLNKPPTSFWSWCLLKQQKSKPE